MTATFISIWYDLVVSSRSILLGLKIQAKQNSDFFYLKKHKNWFALEKPRRSHRNEVGHNYNVHIPYYEHRDEEKI